MSDAEADVVARLNAAVSGRYHVHGELGEGGMATVYLADDLKHGRKVALKVLKPELAAVVGAERFLSEIKTTANLQHPHILPLFDSGEADGFLYYVMPYVEGESLRERLEREKQLPVEEAVRLASDVAEALEHAHRRGVIHRDIKPANVLLQEGRPLVADFGIALAVGATGGSRLTETGLSVGTPYYMSPEQATGDQAVGPPSDTYALACVLYEMLVGEPPYVGATAQAVLGRIISGGPVSAVEQRSAVPGNVDAAIRRGLEKLPPDRFASAKDFAEALADPGFRHGDVRAAGVSSTARKRMLLVSWAVTVVLALALAWSATRPDPLGPTTRVSVRLPDDQRRTVGGSFDLSTDGTIMVYHGGARSGNNWSIWARRWGELEATVVPGSEGTRGVPAISPDGAEVAFWASDEIRVTRLEGGVSRSLVTDSLATGSMRWSPDGEWLYFQRSADPALSRVPTAGGPMEPVATLSGDARQEVYFDILPGGRGAVAGVRIDGEQTILGLDLRTGTTTPLTAGMFPRYASGRLLFQTPGGNTLLAAPFDPERIELTGPPTRVVEGLYRWEGTPAGYFAVSQTGTLVYSREMMAPAGEVVYVSRQGATAPVEEGWSYTMPTLSALALSPDGTRLVLPVADRTGLNANLWIKDLAGGALTRLTSGPGAHERPRWSPDGRFILFPSYGEGDYLRSVYSIPATGTGEAVQLWELPWSALEAVYSPDMEWLLASTDGGESLDIWGVRPGTDSAPVPLIVTDSHEGMMSISPDGRWLLYASNETGQDEIYVRPFPDVDAGKWAISVGGGSAPLWAHSGREIFYVNAASEMIAARIETTPGFSVIERSTLFSLPEGAVAPRGRLYALYDVAPGDDQFLMFRGDAVADSELILVQNWLNDLEGR